MTQVWDTGPSSRAQELFTALKRRKNVLLVGPPGTGKTRLLSEIAHWFEADSKTMSFDPADEVPFPPRSNAAGLLSPQRSNRKCFHMTFHPGIRYRHLLRGLEPDPAEAGGFRYSRGTLFEANEHACLPDGASLVLIDELNRGPAVEAFGDAIVAIEADRRLDDDGDPGPLSYPLQLPSDQGQSGPYHLSAHLYLLAAMNEADASIAPIDVAFRRRWELARLLPERRVAESALGIETDTGEPEILMDTTSVQTLFRVFIDAWSAVNRRIELLRGSDYQLGHAVAIPEPGREIQDAGNAVAFVEERWGRIEDHVAEVFFGDPRVEVAVLAGSSEVTYSVEEHNVGTELGRRTTRPRMPQTITAWIRLLRDIAAND